MAQAQLEARNPAGQDRGRVVARAPLEAKRRGYFSLEWRLGPPSRVYEKTADLTPGLKHPAASSIA